MATQMDDEEFPLEFDLPEQEQPGQPLFNVEQFGDLPEQEQPGQPLFNVEQPEETLDDIIERQIAERWLKPEDVEDKFFEEFQLGVFALNQGLLVATYERNGRVYSCMEGEGGRVWACLALAYITDYFETFLFMFNPEYKVYTDELQYATLDLRGVEKYDRNGEEMYAHMIKKALAETKS
jgi:hypothetical protein